jgi:hypothetical protein
MEAPYLQWTVWLFLQEPLLAHNFHSIVLDMKNSHYPPGLVLIDVLQVDEYGSSVSDISHLLVLHLH